MKYTPIWLKIKILEDKDIRISMSGKGNIYDNAFVESFFKTLR